MDFLWGDERTQQFITNVGLVTSTGPFGANVMACEWTHLLSYRPALIAICIRPGDATYENIRATKEFGVNLASTDQAMMSSVSGGTTGKEVDKVKALKEMGFKFYQAKNIKAPMVDEAALNMECKLVKEMPLGDHTMLVGEVIEAGVNSERMPLAYHQGRYGQVQLNVPRPSPEERERLAEIVRKHRKSLGPS